MSIKKLFDSTDTSRNYLSDTTEKNAFKTVESGRNVKQISEIQDAFVPQVDYTDPENFARYGSAYLYYKSSIERIIDFYPYDGSDAEINKFYNDSLAIDKYIFDNLYPRTNGYVKISVDGWGTRSGDKIDGWGLPATLEYITFHGGPNTSSYTNLSGAFPNPHDSKYQSSNIYDTTIYTTAGLPTTYGTGSRESNLQCNFDKGVTTEFWLLTGSLNTTTQTVKQCVVDIWNNELSSSHAYGRVTVSLNAQAAASPFRLTVQSGTTGIFEQVIGNNLTVADLAAFKHYAITAQNSGSVFITKLYVDGALNDTNVTSATTLGELPSKNMRGRVGALLTAPSASAPAASLVGGGKLTGSIDEFRFWKVARDPAEIGRHWFTQVRGGTNTDISNTTLGVYFKFNEGITTVTATDSTVLDYSGRISNGQWTGYSTDSRTTTSAIVEAGAAGKEYKDPIIYTTNPHVVTVKADLLNSGSYHDGKNNTAFVNMMPQWVITDDGDTENSDLKKLSHIIGTYLDTLYLQIQALPKFKSPLYTSSSYTPLPFAKHLPQSMGLYTPELFIDANVLERFRNRTDSTLFDSDLTETKNLIYLNLYNNLAHIYKSKGTEKAVRNVFRCFNIDESVVRLNAYSNNQTFELKNNLKQTLVNKTSINFHTTGNLNAVVFQAPETSNGDSLGYISGSEGAGSPAGIGYEYKYGFTAEADVTFPYYMGEDDPITRSFLTASIFGMCSASIDYSVDGTHRFAIDHSNFQVLAIRDKEKSKNARFMLTSSNPFPIPELSSSTFFNVYDNQKWNFSVRLKPAIAIANIVTGSTTYAYDLEFMGIQSELGIVINSFILTSSIAQAAGRKILKAAKRIYVGAENTNVTGANVYPCDALPAATRYWTKYIHNDAIRQHIYDIDNYGVSASYQPISPLDPNNTGYDLLNINTLALNWTFDNVTGSDASGNFTVQDISSGSALIRDNYGWLGNLVGYQHTGKGDGFSAGSTDVIKKETINAYKFISPETVIASDMIQIMSNEDSLYGIQEVPPNFVYSIEKSMYNAISEEMLKFFAGVIDFNNLIGDPVNRYRGRYKALEKLREIFFRRVTTTSNVEKFIDYYKWFDDSLAIIISQLMPASIRDLGDIYNVVESHVLERHKYQSKFPLLEFKTATSGSATGVEKLRYGWRLNHHPVNNLQSTNSPWWQERAERSGSGVISSGDNTIDKERDIYLTTKQLNTDTHLLSTTAKPSPTAIYTGSTWAIRNLTKPYQLEIVRKSEYRGGVNFTQDKNIGFTYNALYPAGPVNTTDDVFVPTNVLFGQGEDLVLLKNTTDETEPNKKVKRIITVQHGRNWEDGLNYQTVKSSMAFPFNIMSTSVGAGYTARIINRVTAAVDVTNLHNDVYGPDMEIPMQGPFTDFAVGGHQSRHIAINYSSSTQALDTWLTRPEAWKLLLGTCVDTAESSGAIGMVGADYPWPEANASGENPYPMTASQKAVYYRGFIAKRPVNIRNILYTTGSTVLGNFQKRYQYLNTVGAYLNPRNFIEEQPTLPTQIFQNNTTGATQTRTFLDIHRTSGSHFEFLSEFSIGYLTAATNDTIIAGRFAAPGGIDTMGVGYRDFRGSEYSVYNSLAFRNLSVIKPQQPPGGPPTGSAAGASLQGTPGIRNYDIHGKDYGFRPLSARHSARFGRDSVFVSDPGATYDQLPSFQKTNRNPKHIIRLNDNIVIGGIIQSGTLRDNFFVNYQIPRADRQYAWVTGAIGEADDIRYYGYAPVEGVLWGLYSSSAGYSAYFNFVTASNKVSTDSIEQPTTRLNTLTVDPVTSSTNTIGFESTVNNNSYINTDLATTADLGADYLNLLLTRRAATYGYTWKASRPQNNPILISEKKTNTLSVHDNTSLTIYPLLPVSMRGRPVKLNFSEGSSNTTLKITSNNEKIFFSDTNLNDLHQFSLNDIVTPYDQVLGMVKSGSAYPYILNWIVYSEKLFPSLSRAFVSSSTTRTGYDNKYWRDNQLTRVSGGADILNTTGRTVSQSFWPLDAQIDFLTRTEAPSLTASVVGLVSDGKAGELQNNYFHYHTGAGPGSDRAAEGLAPGGLYARKHMLSAPMSVVSPSGMLIPETGSGPSNLPNLDPTFVDGWQIPIQAGEALWEAETQAGIVVRSGSSTIFVATASNPWFNEYSDYRHDLKLLAKDYAIIPEYRISEHVEDYIKYGLFNPDKMDTFEIVGTNINSTTSSFYKDYSNSEFMSDFLNVKADSLLDAKEIRLVCSAAIRLNPYKGFYPAQRSLDLVTQFSRSYGEVISAKFKGEAVVDGSELWTSSGSLTRPLFQTLFSPGILYNSIKAGMAVDYPILTDATKVNREFYGAASALDTQNWAITPGNLVNAGVVEGYDGTGSYWDYRIPFEAIIEPDKYLADIDFFDVEPHPSASFAATASWTGKSTDQIYTLMAKNFFGEVGNFFLKDSKYTQLKSDTITDDLRFENGSLYGARLKMRRSTTGARIYTFESGSDGANTAYGRFGALFASGSAFQQGTYPLPQDPRARRIPYKENFTMYSRPTAFGPPCGGRPVGNTAGLAAIVNTMPLDSFTGFNGAFTPAYYNGEGWVDFIFRPTADVTYDLERILAETQTVYWRVDPGVDFQDGTGPVLLAEYANAQPIYDGFRINHNIMQVSASLNLFGVERVVEQEKDKFGNPIKDLNKTAGAKWVIQPKFETPMMNFNDEGVHPITDAAGNLTLPANFGSASVPRGIWHQFGTVPDSPNKGIFLEIGDIPSPWLKYHYDVINSSSIYNDNNVTLNGPNVARDMKSFSSIFGFDRDKNKVRLGELADSRTIKEAIVAIPYIIEPAATTSANDALAPADAVGRKQFIEIPNERYKAALSETDGSLTGDSLEAAGESIRKLVQKMANYSLPPQFDFLSNKEIAPIVMYIFEFEYTFDKDDLAYIWQNIAPREYKKISFQHQSIAHNLMDTELLSQDNVVNDKNLRWMVFKVKQKSQTSYFDLIPSQVGQAASQATFNATEKESSYQLSFNWPYDYISFVELIKLDAEILYKKDEDEVPSATPTTQADRKGAATPLPVQMTQLTTK